MWIYASTNPIGLHGAERDFTFTTSYIIEELSVTKSKVFVLATKMTIGAICIATAGRQAVCPRNGPCVHSTAHKTQIFRSALERDILRIGTA